MKKILLLGGSAQQIIAIKASKEMGLYTVLCDYLVDNPGQYYADRFYLVSTTDKQAIMEVAVSEGVDGVLAYASDPAAPTAAYVAEMMGFPTSPYNSVETLCNKDKFRSFLNSNGFNSPFACGYDSVEQAVKDVARFELPLIIKPVDSSGSKGVCVIREACELTHFETAVRRAFSFSRSHRIIIEEYIEKNHPFLIGGDIFVEKGKVVLWGLLNCHRDTSVNPLVPVGKSFPLELSNTDLESVKKTLQRIVDKLHIDTCGMNVELIVDKEGRVWPIDIGPRNGGNMIPDLLQMIFGVNVVELAVKSAMGETETVKICNGTPYYATYNLHTAENGVFEGIEYSDEIRKYIVRECIYKKQGDKVEFFDNASKAIGIIFLKFNSKNEMFFFLGNMNDHIKIHVLD